MLCNIKCKRICIEIRIFCPETLLEGEESGLSRILKAVPAVCRVRLCVRPGAALFHSYPVCIGKEG